MHDRVNTNKIGKSTVRTRDYWLRKHTFSIYAKDSIIMMDTCVVLMIYIHGTNTSDGASFPFCDIGVYTLHEYSFRDIGVYTLHEYLLIVTFFCFKFRSVSELLLSKRSRHFKNAKDTQISGTSSPGT